MNKRIFLISHGGLAQGMAHALEMLTGDTGALTAYGLMPGESPEYIADAIQKVILEHPEDRIFIAADLLCGSVSNAATRLARYPNVRMFNGMNLCLAFSLCFADPDVSDRELEEMLEEARNGLNMVTPVEPDGTPDEDEIL